MDDRLGQRLDKLEEHLVQVSETLEGIVKSVTAINIGIQGNNDHDQLGYRHRIKKLEDEVGEIQDFKKKIQYTASAIAFIGSFVANAIWIILQKLN